MLIRNNITKILKAKFLHFGAEPQPTDFSGILSTFMSFVCDIWGKLETDLWKKGRITH